MKKAILNIVLTALVISVFSGCSSSEILKSQNFYKSSFSVKKDENLLVTKSNGSELYFNKASCEITIKNNENEWKTFPFFKTENKKISEGVYSPFVLHGFDEAEKPFTLDSYVDGFYKNQYEVKKIKNGFELEMTLGKIEKERLLPLEMRVEIFDDLISQMTSSRAKKRMKLLFRKYSLKDENASEEVKKGWVSEYPIIKKYDIYAIKNDVTDREKDELEKYIKTTNFTLEKQAKEYQIVDYKGKTNDKPVVVLSVDFTLDNGDLLVEMPIEKIKYNTKKYVLNKIDFLPNLSAAFANDGKYMFLPDGSGAIIDLAQTTRYFSGKITLPIYGDKNYLDEPYGKQTARLPVFALAKGNMAMLAIIEDGDAVSSVTGEYNNKAFKTVYPTFIYKDYYEETANSLGGQGVNWATYEKGIPSGSYKVRYKLITGKKTDYVALAGAYREYLIKNDVLNDKNLSQNALYVETLGVIGIKNGKKVLTSFSDDKRIIDNYKESGVDNLVLRLKAWSNGGLQHSKYDKIDYLNNGLDKKAFNDLLTYSKTKSVKVFPDADFMTVYKGGFNANSSAARTINDNYHMVSLFDAATGDSVKDSFSYVLKPSLLHKTVKSFIEKNSFENLSVSTMGNLVYSDFSNSSKTNRTVSKKLIVSCFEMLKKQSQLMVDGGNAYSLKYADYIMNLPETSSSHKDYYSTIPFYQIVVHGYKNYTGEAVNLSSEPKDAFLKSLETGSNLYFTFAYKNSSFLKETPFSEYFSTDYSFWFKESVRMYQENAEIFKSIYDKPITDYKKFSNNVYSTTYGNSVTIIVNYNSSAVVVQGKKIDAKGYFVVKEG